MYLEHDLFESTQSGVVGVDDLGLPALALGVARVHSVQIGGKERGLLPAGAGAYFDDRVLFVVGIFWH